jgi:hypothetical protein
MQNDTDSLRNHVACPFCRSVDTEPLSLFGQQLLTVQYYCNECRTPFEKCKDVHTLDDFARQRADEHMPH